MVFWLGSEIVFFDARVFFSRVSAIFFLVFFGCIFGVFFVFFGVFVAFWGCFCAFWFFLCFVFRALARKKNDFFGAGMSKTGISRSGPHSPQPERL